MQEQPKITFSDLPPEIHYHIFSYLPLKELLFFLRAYNYLNILEPNSLFMLLKKYFNFKDFLEITEFYPGARPIALQKALQYFSLEKISRLSSHELAMLTGNHEIINIAFKNLQAEVEQLRPPFFSPDSSLYSKQKYHLKGYYYLSGCSGASEDKKFELNNFDYQNLNCRFLFLEHINFNKVNFTNCDIKTLMIASSTINHTAFHSCNIDLILIRPHSEIANLIFTENNHIGKIKAFGAKIRETQNLSGKSFEHFTDLRHCEIDITTKSMNTIKFYFQNCNLTDATIHNKNKHDLSFKNCILDNIFFKNQKKSRKNIYTENCRKAIDIPQKYEKKFCPENAFKTLYDCLQQYCNNISKPEKIRAQVTHSLFKMQDNSILFKAEIKSVLEKFKFYPHNNKSASALLNAAYKPSETANMPKDFNQLLIAFCDRHGFAVPQSLPATTRALVQGS